MRWDDETSNDETERERRVRDAHDDGAGHDGDVDDDDVDDDDASEDDDDPEVPPRDRERGFAAKMIGDLARRALTTGIGAVFMSEDALRGSLTDMKLPKEAMSYVVGQADRTKKEIVSAIARETREFLARLEVDKVLARALVGTTIEIQTRIRIVPDGDGAKPAHASTDARLVRTDDASKPEPTGPSADEAGGAAAPGAARRRRGKRRRDDTAS